MGASQSDLAGLNAEDVDWEHHVISYARRKTGSIAIMRMDEDMEEVLNEALGIKSRAVAEGNCMAAAKTSTSTVRGFRSYVDFFAAAKPSRLGTARGEVTLLCHWTNENLKNQPSFNEPS